MSRKKHMMSWVRRPSRSCCVHLRLANSANHGVVGDAARGVRLGVEEELGVDHVLGMRPGQVGGREIAKKSCSVCRTPMPS